MSIQSVLQGKASADESKLFLEAEQALNCPAPDSEAEKNAYRSLLADIESRLLRMEAAAAERGRVIRYLALLADKQRHVYDSIEHWSRLRTLVLESLDEINFALGNAYRRAADLKNARLHLDSVSDASIDPQLLADERKRLKKRLSIEASIKGAKRVVKMLTSSTGEGDAHQEISSSLARSRHAYRTDSSVDRLLKEAFDALAKLPEPPPPEAEVSGTEDSYSNYRRLRLQTDTTRQRPGVIFTSGFLWSGSGAVTDMLRGHDDVHVGCSGRELNLFQRRYGLLGLVDAPLGTVGPRELMEFFLGPLAGLLVDRLRVHADRERSLFKAQLDSGQALDALLPCCRSLVQGLEAAARSDPSSLATLSAMRDFSNEITTRLGSPGKKSVVLNNNIFGFNIRLLSLFSNAVAVTVKRDPRDQYVAHYYERKRSDVMPIDEFISKTRNRYDEHDRAVAELQLDDRVISIRFEDFVLDEKTRRNVLDRLQLTRSDVRGETCFDPEKSRRNIGIHRSFDNQSDIRRIEESFPDMLYQST